MVAAQIQAAVQFFQRGKFRSGLVDFSCEFLAVSVIARILQGNEKRRELTLLVHVQRGQFLFENFNAHEVILLQLFPQSTVTLFWQQIRDDGFLFL